MTKKPATADASASTALAPIAPRQTPATITAAPISVSDVPAALLAELHANAAAGMETLTADDMLIPRLAVLQSISAQLNSRKAEFIAGAKAGDIADLGSGRLFPEGVLLVPVMFNKQFIEWAPRSSGKGFIYAHTDRHIMAETQKGPKNENLLPNGNEIVETATHYCLNVSDHLSRCIVQFTSSQMKKSKQWMHLCNGIKFPGPDGRSFTGPMFAGVYRLTSVPESNTQGDWWGWRIESVGRVDEVGAKLGIRTDHLIAEAKDYAASIRSGAAVIDNATTFAGSEHARIAEEAM